MDAKKLKYIINIFDIYVNQHQNIQRIKKKDKKKKLSILSVFSDWKGPYCD